MKVLSNYCQLFCRDSTLKFSSDSVEGFSLYFDSDIGIVTNIAADPLTTPQVTVGAWVKVVNTNPSPEAIQYVVNSLLPILPFFVTDKYQFSVALPYLIRSKPINHRLVPEEYMLRTRGAYVWMGVPMKILRFQCD